jgi:hypothetical protein
MDGPPPEEEDFSQIPLVERSQHKVRTDSFDSFSPSDDGRSS